MFFGVELRGELLQAAGEFVDCSGGDNRRAQQDRQQQCGNGDAGRIARRFGPGFGTEAQMQESRQKRRRLGESPQRLHGDSAGTEGTHRLAGFSASL